MLGYCISTYLLVLSSYRFTQSNNNTTVAIYAYIYMTRFNH